jgi:hypothetical protein
MGLAVDYRTSVASSLGFTVESVTGVSSTV